MYLNKTGENHIVKKLIWDNADDILLNEKRLQDNATIWSQDYKKLYTELWIKE